MNRTVETNAHRHRIGPPRWGFGLFRGPVPRPMAWADFGLSRCDVGAPLNDTRAGVGSGTQFRVVVGGDGRSRTTTPHHATMHTTRPIRGPYGETSHPRCTHMEKLWNQTGNDIDHPHRTNGDTRQTPTNVNHRVERKSTYRKHESPANNPKPRMGWSDVSPGHRPGFATQLQNITPTGWPEIRKQRPKPITTNDRHPHDTMNQTS